MIAGTCFRTAHPFTNPIKSLVLQLTRHFPKSASSRCGICIPILRIVPWVNQTQHPKRHLDRFSRFCTAHRRASLYSIMGRTFPEKLPLPMRDLDPIKCTVPWVRPSLQAKRHLDRFSRFCSAHYCDRPTDRPTDRQTDRPSVNTAREHGCHFWTPVNTGRLDGPLLTMTT